VTAAVELRERGSALVTAMLVLFVVTGLGVGLLFITQLEMQMGREDARSKQAFYLAEAGLEQARESLRISGAGIDTMLDAASGPDTVIDFDPASLRVQFDAAGNVTGLSGFNDDVPLVPITPFGAGVYAAFLTNDPGEGPPDYAATKHDSNRRLTVTAVGVGPGRKIEMTQAIVEQDSFPPPPAAITLLGPTPTFYPGNSTGKHLTGRDCNGTGVPGLYVPVVGVVGAAAEASAETSVAPGDTTLEEGTVVAPQYGTDAIDDLTGTINPLWTDCTYLHELAADVRAQADVIGDASTSLANFGAPGNPKMVYIEGDYYIGDDWNGAGLLWVTGTLDLSERLDWTGTIFVVGTGDYQRNWSIGNVDGAVIVANIAGPDGLMWTADDCAGADGTLGTADDGFESASFTVADPGDGLLSYCQQSIDAVATKFSFAVTQFRQR